MNSLEIAAITFACVCGGVALGMILRAILPEPHLSSDARDVIKLAMGLIATLSALVLGLLVASAKSSFDAQRTGFQQLGTNLLVLDRTLARYGPDAKPARELLRRLVASAIDRLWPSGSSRSGALESSEITASGTALYEAIRGLTPHTEAERAAQTQALQIASELTRTRWLLTETQDSSIPTAFLVVLIFWLTILFTGFGLFAARNATVIVALLLCALSVSGALLLIVDLDQPFAGLIHISPAPLQRALSQFGQ